MFTVHVDLLMTIGLCLIPGGAIMFYLCAFIFQAQEIGAMAIAGVVCMCCWVAAAGLILLGIGQQIH